MRKTICAILVVAVFSAMVMGCSKTKDEEKYVCVLPTILYDEEGNEITGSTEPASAEIKDKSYYIQDHQDSKVYFEDDYSIEYTIPEILVDSDYARECNAEIYAIAQKDLAEQDGTFSTVWGMEYDSYLNGSILSVVMNHFTDSGNFYYSIYNVDVVTGEKVSLEQLLEAAGMTTDDYTTGLKDAHLEGVRVGWFIPDGKTIEEYIQETNEKTQQGDFESFIRTQMDNTLSVDNMSKAKAYLGDNGKLWLANNIYSLGGADCYERLFEFPTE